MARTDTDTDATIPEPPPVGPPGSWPVTDSFPRRRHQPGHSAHNSSSSLADDEESLAGSLHEANVHPKPEKRRSPQSSDIAGSQHDYEFDRTPRITRHSHLGSSTSLETTRATPSRSKGKARARVLNPSTGTDTRTTKGRRTQDLEERVDICVTSEEPLYGAPSRSSVEVEQLVSSAGHAPDPRDFYAPDSPVLDEYPDLGQDLNESSSEEFLEYLEPNVQYDDQVESSITRHQPSVLPHQHLFSQPQSFASSSKTARLSSSQQMLALQPPMNPATPLSRRNGPSVSQPHDVAFGGRSSPRLRAFAGTQNADVGQQESHTTANGVCCQHQKVDNHGRTHEERSRRNIGETIRKRGRSPQRREGEKLELSKLVRMEIDSLLQDDPPYGRAPSPSQVSRFAAEWKRTGQGARACNATPVDFMIDFAGKPRSPWNTSAARVFTDHFIGKMECSDTPEMRKKVENAFTNRIKSLKCRRKKEGLPQAERANERSKHGRRQRKYQVFHRRRNIAKLVGPLTKHLGILDALGDDGMSTDESFVDPDTHQTTYTVTKPEWRHPDLHNWLGVFDQLHHRSHIESWSFDKRGAFPHIRAGSQKVHRKSHAPTGLPINAYDPRWIESREPLYLNHVLCPQMDQQYNFVHSSDVFALLSR